MARPFESACYCTNIRRIANILTDFYNRKLAQTGINVAQFCLLRNLDRLSSANLSVWAKKTGIERTTMVRDAKRLAEQELIEQIPGRGKVYQLSPKGRQCLKDGAFYWDSAQRHVEEVFGQDNIAALLKMGEEAQTI